MKFMVGESKVKVVPFGANVDCNRTQKDIKNFVDYRPTDRCKLLFIGVDWKRKGGDIALAVAKALNQSGLKTELTVVGSKSITADPLPSFVRAIGFIDKSTTQGQAMYQNLLSSSHFLILPSRADCTPIVFCEAGSFGIPCISTNVGGIPSIIKDNINGRAFSGETSIDEYCAYISNLFSKYADYKKMALASFREYQTRFNWTVAGQAVKNLLKELGVNSKGFGKSKSCAAQL